MHIFSAPFNHSFLISFELKVYVLGFFEINYLYIFERKNLSVRYQLGILKCGVSLERLFKSGVFLIVKGAWSQKSKRVDWNHNPIVLLEGLVRKP